MFYGVRKANELHPVCVMTRKLVTKISHNRFTFTFGISGLFMVPASCDSVSICLAKMSHFVIDSMPQRLKSALTKILVVDWWCS